MNNMYLWNKKVQAVLLKENNHDLILIIFLQYHVLECSLKTTAI